MRGAFRKAWALLTVMYAYMIEYRAELLLWALANSLPFILMGVWMKAGATGVFDLGPEGFARYFLWVFVVRQVTAVWVIWDFEYDVLHGRLSPRLLQPIDPVWRYVAAHLAERVARLPFAFALVGLFFLLYSEAWATPALENAAAAVVLVLLAFVLRFAIQYTFAMATFWVERANAIESIWNLLFLFLSGYIAPLTLFPDVVREVALYTPLPYLVYVPVAVLLGLEVDVGQALLVMAAWTAGALLLNRVAWHLGLKRYSAMGA